MRIVTSSYFWLLLAWSIFFHPSFSTCLCVWISNECLTDSIYLEYAFFIHSDNLCLLIREFNILTLRVITGYLGGSVGQFCSFLCYCFLYSSVLFCDIVFYRPHSFFLFPLISCIPVFFCAWLIFLNFSICAAEVSTG